MKQLLFLSVIFLTASVSAKYDWSSCRSEEKPEITKHSYVDLSGKLGKVLFRVRTIRYITLFDGTPGGTKLRDTLTSQCGEFALAGCIVPGGWIQLESETRLCLRKKGDQIRSTGIQQVFQQMQKNGFNVKHVLKNTSDIRFIKVNAEIFTNGWRTTAVSYPNDRLIILPLPAFDEVPDGDNSPELEVMAQNMILLHEFFRVHYIRDPQYEQSLLAILASSPNKSTVKMAHHLATMNSRRFLMQSSALHSGGFSGQGGGGGYSGAYAKLLLALIIDGNNSLSFLKKVRIVDRILRTPVITSPDSICDNLDPSLRIPLVTSSTSISDSNDCFGLVKMKPKLQFFYNNAQHFLITPKLTISIDDKIHKVKSPDFLEFIEKTSNLLIELDN